MSDQRHIRSERRLSLLKTALSHFLLERAQEGIFISLFDLRSNASGHTITVYCSIFPEEAKQRTLAFLKRQERACKAYLKENTALRSIPTIRFVSAERIPFEAN